VTVPRSANIAAGRTGNLVGFAACAALLAYALYSEQVLGLQPCPLCILQRIAVFALGLAFLAAALHRAGRAGALAWAALVALIALAGAAIAGRHVWITSQPPGTVAECGASLDYMLEVLPLREVLAKVLTGSGECGKIDWRFLGLSMPAWVLVWLLALGAWGVFVNLRRQSARAP
jgi:disulfide bond formation protein DsbB